jgi:DNA ligase-1
MFLLPNRWNNTDPTGWLGSEKLDGFRAKWTGKQFLSKGGHPISVPPWFSQGLPKESLDGELWAGRGKYELVAAAVQGHRDRDWEHILFAVFDAPEYKGAFESRIKRAQEVISANPRLYRALGAKAFVLPFWVCEGRKHLLVKLDEIVDAGGEGIVIRKPGSMYTFGYSDTLLKIKKKFDAEAVVIGHVEGNRPGLCGSLKVMTKDGKIFKVASGMTEAMAHTPPPIGTVITYQYDTLTSEGIPRPATFLRIRRDI